MDPKPFRAYDAQQHQRMAAMLNSRADLPEGSRADVNELNRRNRELLAANVKLQDENQSLRRRLRVLGERV